MFSHDVAMLTKFSVIRQDILTTYPAKRAGGRRERPKIVVHYVMRFH
jgi:hypothetical protein